MRMSTTKFLIKPYIQRYIKKYFFYLFLRIIYIGSLLLIPIYLSFSINNMMTNLQETNVYNLLLKLFALIFIQFIISYIVNDYNIKLSNSIAFKIEYDTLEYIKYVKYEEVKKYNDTYLTQRINNDAVCIGDYIVEKFPYFLTDCLLILTLIPILFHFNIKLSLFIIISLLLFYLLYLLLKKKFYCLKSEMLESQGNFFTMLSNQIFNILSIKINSWFSETSNEFVLVVDKFFKKSISFLRLDFLYGNFMEILKYLSYGCCLFILFNDLKKNTITIGEITTIIFYIEILFTKIQGISSFFKYKEAFNVSSDRINELFILNKEINGDEKIFSIDEVMTQNLSLNINNKIIFSNQNLIFKKGNIYLIKGENGSGKTSFINTLLGVLTNTEGTILYNNINLHDIDMYYMRKNNISYVAQEPTLHDGSILDNLTYGISFPENECIIDAIVNKYSNNLLKFLENQQKGINTLVTSKNISLSGGEKQKIALVHAFLKNPDLLVLDEPTSALDIESVNYLLIKLKALKNNKIIIIISHDERLKDIVDVIYNF